MPRQISKPLTIVAIALVVLLLFGGCDNEENEKDDGDQSGLPDTNAPDDNDDPYTGDDDAADDDDDDYESKLLERFQPVLLQKLPDPGPALYPETSDMIGALSLHESQGMFDYEVRVDTAKPIMYTSFNVARIRDKYYNQLIYAFSYPERPVSTTLEEHGFLDHFLHIMEQGPVDGKAIRITLDQYDQEPLFIEVARNCGCSWRLYVNKDVEELVKAEFNQNGLEWNGIARPGTPDDEPFINVMPANIDEAPIRPVVVAQDGFFESPHDTMGSFTSYDQMLKAELDILRGELYLPDYTEVQIPDTGDYVVKEFSVTDYDVLYYLPLYGTEVQMGIFDENHYVWNSYPPMYWILYALDLVNHYPGTPIDKDHLKVVHDTMDFWDTAILYDTLVYLPEGIFGAQ